MTLLNWKKKNNGETATGVKSGVIYSVIHDAMFKRFIARQNGQITGSFDFVETAKIHCTNAEKSKVAFQRHN